MPSDAEEEQYHEIFELMGGDPTGSGRGVGLDELAKFFQELPDSPPMCQIEEIFRQCDEDGNSEIDPEEFINVVETIKLLQNKTTNEIIESFVGTHFKDIFIILDTDGVGSLRKEDIRNLFEKQPQPSTAISSTELLGIIIQVENATGRIEFSGFKHIAAMLVPKVNMAVHLEALKDIARDMHPVKSSTSIASSMSKGGIDHRASLQSSHSIVLDGGGECPNCVVLKSKNRDLELQVESERLHSRESHAKEESSSAKEQKSERLNRDLCFENEQLKKRLRSYESGAEAKKQKDAKTKEAGEREVIILKQLEVQERDLSNISAELDANKKALVKQRAESGRQSAALALLHKHIATLERDNEILKKGGDREHVKEQMHKAKVLNNMLAEANKTIEGFQQESWYRSSLRYLTTQKNSGGPHVPHPEWIEPPTAPISVKSSVDSSKRNVSPYQSQAFDWPKQKDSRTEHATVDPSDEEYKILSAYYHHFQASTKPEVARELIEECSLELDKVNTHHPAYWSGKNNLRIKIWMKQPVLSDSAAASNARKKYVVASPASQRSASYNSVSHRSVSQNTRMSSSASPSPSHIPQYTTTSRSPAPPPAYPHARSISPPRRAVGRK